MKQWRRVGRVFIVCALLAIGLVGSAKAEEVIVTIGVGDTILTVSGKTSPDAFVTISKDGGVIGTTTAAADGTYSQTYTAQDPGLHELTIYAHTTGGENTDTVTINVNITEHATTSVQAFLPPSLVVANTNLGVEEPLAIRGEAAPSTTITVYIDNATYATTTSDAQGIWTLSLDTSALASGQHQLFVRAIDGFGDQSYPTAARYFTRAAAIVTPEQPQAPAPADTPPVPVITFPSSDLVWHEPQITIRGSGAPHTQIELWDGDDRLGTVWSNSRGKWSIPLDLQTKEYALRVRACLENQCSAFSHTIRITYEPSNPLSPLGEPLRIYLPETSFTINQHQRLTVHAKVLNGQPAYKTLMHWGEQKPESDTFVGDDLTFTHRYHTPGEYTLTLDVQDAQGRKARVYLSVLVKPEQARSFWTIPFMVLSLIALTLIAYALYKMRSRFRKTPH